MPPFFFLRAARVIVTGRNAERGASVVAACADAPGQEDFIAADLADEGACAELTRAAVERFGPPTVLVNNAIATGVEPRDTKLEDLATATWEQVRRIGISAVNSLPEAADIAAAAAFPASRDSEVLTGVLLPVDGGSSTTARAASFG